jgi:hypothetical protein
LAARDVVRFVGPAAQVAFLGRAWSWRLAVEGGAGALEGTLIPVCRVEQCSAAVVGRKP